MASFGFSKMAMLSAKIKCRVGIFFVPLSKMRYD